MKLQASNKGLIIAIVVLGIINLVSLGIIWFGKTDRPQGHDGPHDARDFLVNKLELNASQTTSFDSLRKIHFATINGYNEELKKLKDQLFDQLHFTNDTLEKKSAVDIGIVQSKIEMQTFEHFSQLRALLNDKQKTEFDQVINDVLRNLHPPGPEDGRRPPPGSLPPPQ